MIEDENKLNQLQKTLDSRNNDLIDKLVDQDDSKQVKDLVNLFNLNHMKKQMIRTLTYDQLLDNIMDQMEQRVTKRADQFSNKDLLDYMNAMGNAIDKAQKQMVDVEAIPQIQINQQNNIVNVSEAENIDRESRKRIIDSVSNILARLNKNNEEVTELNSNSVFIDNEDFSTDVISLENEVEV